MPKNGHKITDYYLGFIFSRPVSFSMNGLVILGLSDTVEDLCFHLSIDILINIWKQNALDMRIMMQ